MKRLLLVLAISVTAYSQSFPGSIFTPIVAKNNVQTRLSASMAAVDTVAVVASSAGWVPNMLAYICDVTTSTTTCTGTYEVMRVTAVVGNVLTVTRGLDGTSAIAHSANKNFSNTPVALYNTSVNNEVLAIETALGANMSNIPVVPVGVPPQILRLRPNVVSHSTLQFTDPTVVNARDYDYPAQTPGGTLTASVGALITLAPGPLGVRATDTRLRYWITGGTGTAESVAGTGAGTCDGTGQASCTVSFTPANSHSGAWTISSSLAGIYEAVAANPGHQVKMTAGVYTMHDCMSFDPTKPLFLDGDGSGSTATTTFLQFGSVSSGCNAISITDSSFSNNEPKIFRHFTMQGTGTTSGGHGIALTKVVRVIIDGVQVNSFALSGVFMLDAFEVTISGGCAIFFNGHWGVEMTGVSNLNRIERSYVGTNSRSDAFGNVKLIGTSALMPTEQITFDGADFSNCGTVPFTAVTTCWGIVVQWATGVNIMNSYSEGNLTNAEIFQGASKSITTFNNWYANAPILFAADVTGVRSWGNTFLGAAAIRTFNNPNVAGYIIGPDNCLAGSGECAAHPSMLGSVSSISLTGAFSTSKVANYIASETGANNAIVGALLDQSATAVPLAAGLVVTVKLGHTLQAGANTFNFNAGGAVAIKKHTNIATDLTVAYAATGVITLLYDGALWLDVSQ